MVDNIQRNNTPDQASQYLIKEKGIIEATYYVQNRLGDCRNEVEETYWTKVLNLLRKAW